MTLDRESLGGKIRRTEAVGPAPTERWQVQKKSPRGSPGSGPHSSLIPMNTLSSVGLHAENVGGTTTYSESLISRGGILGVIRSLGIAAVIALTEAVANNLH